MFQLSGVHFKVTYSATKKERPAPRGASNGPAPQALHLEVEILRRLGFAGLGASFKGIYKGSFKGSYKGSIGFRGFGFRGLGVSGLGVMGSKFMGNRGMGLSMLG